MADADRVAESVELDRVRATADELHGRVARTPLVPLGRSGVWLKAESLQSSGSFKLRGALHSLLALDDEARRRGVVAHSSGNHAIAVAMAAAELGVAATVVMPDDAPRTKLERTRAAGAIVERVAPDSAARTARAAQLATEHGLSPIEPYDSDLVLEATGTIALEVLEQVPDPTAPTVIYAPVSGGGLIGGIARAAQLADPRTRIIGVEPELAADALASRRAGHRVALPADQMARTLADGLRVQQVGARPWPHLVAHVDELVTVSEDELLDAMRRIAGEAGLVAEPSGAVAAAAALARRGLAEGEHDAQVVAILSGANVDAELLSAVLAGATAAELAIRPG
jgi:threonine dehydratase